MAPPIQNTYGERRVVHTGCRPGPLDGESALEGMASGDDTMQKHKPRRERSFGLSLAQVGGRRDAFACREEALRVGVADESRRGEGVALSRPDWDGVVGAG